MEELLWKLYTVTTFRNLLELPAVRDLEKVLSHLDDADPRAMLEGYADLLYQVRHEGFETFTAYIDEHLRYDDTAFGRACAVGEPDSFYVSAARRDIEIFARLANLDFGALKITMMRSHSELREAIGALPVLPRGAGITYEALVESYRKNGVGLFARGRAFHWEHGKLSVVLHPDPIDQDEMIGYESQRQEVLRNTRWLLEGKPSHNVLLYGDSGTGKSATIKSLVNEPDFYNLRLIEVSKNSLDELTELSRLVSTHTQKFILYIDDLAFENEDQSFSGLKTALEGGLELRPENVAIYATSNRRHLIREDFKDRQGSDIHRDETIQERTSLSERFGLRILYMSLDQKQYLTTLRAMCDRRGIAIDDERLLKEANRWQMSHGGRTPRIARQLVDYLESHR